MSSPRITDPLDALLAELTGLGHAVFWSSDNPLDAAPAAEVAIGGGSGLITARSTGRGWLVTAQQAARFEAGDEARCARFMSSRLAEHAAGA